MRFGGKIKVALADIDLCLFWAYVCFISNLNLCDFLYDMNTKSLL